MDNRKWIGDRLFYLLYLRMAELRIVFPEQTANNLKNKRKIYRDKLKNGDIPAPRKPEEYYLGEPPEKIRDRLKPQDRNKTVEQIIDDQSREALHKKLDEVIDQTNINPAFVQGFRVSQWDGMIKTPEGEIETKTLRGIQLKAEAKDFEPAWPVVQQSTSTILPVEPPQLIHREYKTAVILPDTQIGYLKYSDDTFESMHDPKAIAVALEILADVRPDKVIFLGDFLDLPEWGRFEQSPDYARTSQMSIDYGHQLLATVRATVPNAEIVVLEGNHDRRMEKSLKANAMNAFGLRRAQDVSRWPVMSVPYLCNFDLLNVEYVEGYPAGKYWLNERLQIIHGLVVRSNGSTASAVARQENASTIFGHVHRIESHYDTQNVYKGGRANAAHSPGCLCKISGVVPSAKGSTGLDGRPIVSYENWQNGLAVVEYEEGDRPFFYQPIFINSFNNYETRFGGKTYSAGIKSSKFCKCNKCLIRKMV